MKQMYNTKCLTDIFPDSETFKTEYEESKLFVPGHSINNAEVLFYLLYARYGTTPIANYSEHIFKYKLFSIIFQYGPDWNKELEVQARLRGLEEADIVEGGKMIYNHAFHDASAPSTSDTDYISPYINEQNVTNNKKSILAAYDTLMTLLKRDVTEVFLNRFKKCFKTMVRPDYTFIYETELSEDE